MNYFWKPRFEGPWGNSINDMQNQYSLVFHKAYQTDLLLKAGFSSVKLWSPTGMGATCGSLLCHPRLCGVPHTCCALPRAPPETSAQGTWEVLSWQQQQQHSSRDPPSSRPMVTEHFVKCPGLMSTRRAPAALTALPSTRPLLLPREFPFPRCLSTLLSQPGFSL